MPVDPSTAAVLDQVNARPTLRVIDTDPQILREANRQMSAGIALPEPIEVGSVQDTTVPGPAGRIPVRVYRPAGGGPAPTVLFFHGGGWLTVTSTPTTTSPDGCAATWTPWSWPSTTA
ncbi:alpha/beta hydrolase family protein [Streptomyces sp. NPDC059989]|uniref:alpha/beta hydrolase family protein n=1 Tax=Streptomyces sp. NPDC059989 TaxID=3347026 RepID=UPI0036D1A885